MKDNISVIELPKPRCYAIISPSRIVYALDASDKEFKKLKEDESESNIKCSSKPGEKPISKSASVGLIPTLDCNLKCVYCYSKGGEAKDTITYELAVSAIKAITGSNEADRIDQLDIYLVGGGEPLLPFDLIYRVVEFAKSICKNLNIHVVTNGFLVKKFLIGYQKTRQMFVFLMMDQGIFYRDQLA